MLNKKSYFLSYGITLKVNQNKQALLYLLLVILLLPLLLSIAYFLPKFDYLIINQAMVKSIGLMVFQALLSALLSLIIGLALAFFVYNLSNFLQKVVFLFAMIWCLAPLLIVVNLIILFYGKQGLLNDILAYFNINRVRMLHNLFSVVLIHVLINANYVMLIALSIFKSIPVKSWQLSKLYSNKAIFMWLNVLYPATKNAIIFLFVFIFLVCFMSFVPISMLGGTSVSSPSLEIFHAIQVADDAKIAFWLVFLLSFVPILLLFVKQLFSLSMVNNAIGLSAYPFKSKIVNMVALILFFLYVVIWIVPFLLLIQHMDLQVITFWLQNDIFQKSLKLTLMSALAASIISLFFVIIVLSSLHNIVSLLVAIVTVMIPPFLWLAVILFGNFASLDFSSKPIILLIYSQIITSIPLFIYTLSPAITHVKKEYQPLAILLGVSKTTWLFKILLMQIKRQVLIAFIIGFSYCFGEYYAIALIGDTNFQTIPALVRSLIGRYRIVDATNISLIIISFYAILIVAMLAIMSKKSNVRS